MLLYLNHRTNVWSLFCRFVSIHFIAMFKYFLEIQPLLIVFMFNTITAKKGMCELTTHTLLWKAIVNMQLWCDTFTSFIATQCKIKIYANATHWRVPDILHGRDLQLIQCSSARKHVFAHDCAFNRARNACDCCSCAMERSANDKRRTSGSGKCRELCA